MIKKLLGLVGVLLLVLVIALAGVFYYIDRIARTAIERGGTYALGVETRLGSADVGLFTGTFALNGLHVANPEGFEAERFLGLAGGSASVDLSTLRSPKVEIPSVRLSGVRMVLEKRHGKANYEVILANLKKLKGPESEEPAPPEQRAGKSYVIRELIIEDIEVQVQLLPIGGDLTKSTVPVEKIRLIDIGEGENGVKMSELSGIIVQAIMTATLRKAGELPGQIAAELGKGLEGVGKIAGGTIEIAGETFGGIGEAAGQLAEGTGEVVGGAAETAGKAAEGAGKAAEKIGEGIGGIFGGGKKEEDEKE